jgi:hypothetical protein
VDEIKELRKICYSCLAGDVEDEALELLDEIEEYIYELEGNIR